MFSQPSISYPRDPRALKKYGCELLYHGEGLLPFLGPYIRIAAALIAWRIGRADPFTVVIKKNSSWSKHNSPIFVGHKYYPDTDFINQLPKSNKEQRNKNKWNSYQEKELQYIHCPSTTIKSILILFSVICSKNPVRNKKRKISRIVIRWPKKKKSQIYPSSVHQLLKSHIHKTKLFPHKEVSCVKCLRIIICASTKQACAYKGRSTLSPTNQSCEQCMLRAYSEHVHQPCDL